MQRVAFQGEVGAFSEEAVGVLMPAGRPVPFPSFEAVFEALMREDVDAAVVPIENTLFGSVHVNYDLLREHEVRIVGEVNLRIRHNLLVRHGVRYENITCVMSHPQALGQCKTFLRSHLPDVEQRAVYDTAGAAKRVATIEDRSVAAIASIKAADVYDLHVLAESIESNHQNYTRFLALSRSAATRSLPGAGGSKTSIVYALGKTEPGSLFRALSIFAENGIDLLKIESRPLIGIPGSYMFYLDLDGSATDANVASALSKLQGMADFVRVLGSYPRGMWVDGSSITASPA